MTLPRTTIQALDPGSVKLGAALLGFEPGKPVIYLGGGNYELGDPALVIAGPHLILEVLDENLYAFNQARVREMVLTARMEGQLLGLARAAGIEPMTTTAGEARGDLCRSANASDKQVAIVVEALIEGVPKHLPKKERVHIYDACLYGLVGFMRLGARFKLPPAAEMALHSLREQERAKAAAKGKATKAARQIGAMR